MKAVNGMKVCSKCGVEKPVEEYTKNRTTSDGLTWWCKACEREGGRKYREANLEKVRERNRKYREANREKVLEQKRKYREANRERERERDRRYYEANLEKVRERNRKYREANREKVLEQKRKYREANRERERERDLEYYQSNPLWAKRNSRRNNERAARRNAYALSVATRAGLPFTEVEDAIILSRPVNLELALELGRGLKAVGHRKTKLRRKMKEGAA